MRREELELDPEGFDYEYDTRAHQRLRARVPKNVVTQSIDFLLDSIPRYVEDGTIELTPHYQRRRRWTRLAQSKLIESLFMEIPLPPVFLAEERDSSFSVIDGQQRLTAVSDFLNGRFALEGLLVFSDFNGLVFSDLPFEYQVSLKRKSIRAIAVYSQISEDFKYEIFDRLNTGGVALTPQEIRNITFQGPFNELLIELSQNKQFQRMLGIEPKNPDSSRIYREMKDCELVLRFFALSEETYSGRLIYFLNDFMMRNYKTDDLDRYRRLFLSTIEKTYAVFGEHSFKKWDPKKGRWLPQVNVALYEAQMVVLKDMQLERLVVRREEILTEFKKLFADNEFFNSITSSTNHQSAYNNRIGKLREVMQGR